MTIRLFCCLLLSVSALAACSDNTLTTAPGYQPDHQPGDLQPPRVQDDFIQSSPNKSDILFAIDDSGSMSEEHDALIDNFDNFAQFLIGSELDYHIGILDGALGGSSFLNAGKLVGNPLWIEASTVDPDLAFLANVGAIGGGGGDCENGLLATNMALSPPQVNGYNDGFYRDEAILTVIIITDEDADTGDPFGSCDVMPISQSEYISWILDLKGGDYDLVNFGIIAGYAQDNITLFPCVSFWGGAAGPAFGYEQIAPALNGTTWSICNEDWSSVMTQLGLAAAGISTTFSLSRLPQWDYWDWDGDGNTSEPVLELQIDRLDGAGFVDVQPLDSANPDPINPWTYDRSRNAVIFDLEVLPAPTWVLRAVYPAAESG